MAEEDIQEKIDLSGKGLKKLDKAVGSQNQATVLILDDNELQRLDNVGTYSSLQKLSAVRNQLIRMYGVSKLLNLTSLNLAHNNLVGIEGLKELLNLRWLCLAGNNVKAIDHLNTNINLEHLDLSENNIGCISDLSHLQNLKELLLHGNRISGLQFCQRYLPLSLESLSLADNRIADLNEVCHVSHLPILREFTIAGNPCVAAAAAVASHPHTPGQCVGFDYRPFVINWCMNLRVLDGCHVDAKESLRAEWLYSQGKGRSFRVGEQEALIVYLSSVCPPLPSGGALGSSSYGPRGGPRPASAPGTTPGWTETTNAATDNGFPPPAPQPSSATLSEEDRKLLLILSKAQLHQRELREQQKADKGSNNAPSAFGMSSSYSSTLSSTAECPEKGPLEEEAIRAPASSEGGVASNGRSSTDSGVKTRPSSGSSSFASPYVRRRVKDPPSRGSPKRCSSRTSCSRQDQHHLRRFSSTGGEMVSSSSYNVELPVTLYGEESASNAMVASMDEERVSWAGLRHKDGHKEKENLMTRSLDPSLLSCTTTEDSGLDSGDLHQERGSVVSVDVLATSEPPSHKPPPSEIKSAWTGTLTATSRSLSGEDLTSNHRPKKLFSQGRVGDDAVESTELKEGSNLEALTDDGNENPLQTATKLVPVPESIVSPEYRPPASYMPTASGAPRQGGDVDRRRGGQGWGGGMPSLSRSGSSGQCCSHGSTIQPPSNYYGPSTGYAAHQAANATHSSSSSPGTRRANLGQHQQHPSAPSQAHIHHHHFHHAPPAPPEPLRCAGRHSHASANSAAVAHSLSSSAVSSAASVSATAATRGPPPVPSYYPTSTPSATGSPMATRHACHVSSFHHNPAQHQGAQQGRSGTSSRRGGTRSDVHGPHSPAMGRAASRARGAKIRKVPTGESGGGKRGGEGGRGTKGGGGGRGGRGEGGGRGGEEEEVVVGESSGDNSDSEMSISKLEAIKCVAVGRRQKGEGEEGGGGAEEGSKEGVGGEGGQPPQQQQDDNEEEEERRRRRLQERAVLKIQSLWRGYRCRNESAKTAKNGEDTFDGKGLKEDIQAMRMEDHIRLLSKELEVTRGELGKERKLRLQQMEAIKSLWKEVFSMQNKGTPNCLQSPVEGMKAVASPPSEEVASIVSAAAVVDASVVAELSRTCATLQGQVQHLQDFLKQAMKYMSAGVSSRGENANAAIQTYISAVMTPQGMPPGTFPPFPFGLDDEENKGGQGEGAGDGSHQLANGESRPSYLPIFGETTAATAVTPPSLPKDGAGDVEGVGGEEDVSREMQHYVEGLVDGVLKAVVPDEDDEKAAEGGQCV